MSSPAHVAGNAASWVAWRVINNLDGKNLNCDDVGVSDISARIRDELQWLRVEETMVPPSPPQYSNKV